MEPRIPDGAYCLFASPVTGTCQGRTVLVRLRDAVDPDTGERFTVKRYRSEKSADEDGWRHVRIVLEPVNPDFTPIELKTEDEGSVAVVAELVEVIGSEPPGRTNGLSLGVPRLAPTELHRLKRRAARRGHASS